MEQWFGSTATGMYSVITHYRTPHSQSRKPDVTGEKEREGRYSCMLRCQLGGWSWRTATSGYYRMHDMDTHNNGT